MRSLGLSANKLAFELHVPATRIGEIVNERRRITALRLARYFKTNAEFLAELAEFLRFGVRAARREDLGDRTAGAAGGGGVVSLQLLKKGNLAEKCS